MPHACHRFWKCCKTVTFCPLLTRDTILGACHAKRHLNLQKRREHVVFCTFSLRKSSKCVSRHNGVHFFDIATCKSGVSMVCFVHFDLEMCFAPQRRTLFRYLNFKKWSETQVFCTFSLQSLLRATTACNFSFLISPDVSASAALASLLFDFRPSGATTHRKNTVFRDFPTFSHTCIFFLLIFSLLTFLPLTLLPSGSSHLCFFTVFRDFPTFAHTCIFFLLIFSLLTFLPADSAPLF